MHVHKQYLRLQVDLCLIVWVTVNCLITCTAVTYQVISTTPVVCIAIFTIGQDAQLWRDHDCGQIGNTMNIYDMA